VVIVFSLLYGLFLLFVSTCLLEVTGEQLSLCGLKLVISALVNKDGNVERPFVPNELDGILLPPLDFAGQLSGKGLLAPGT
jgi:hypothetical protein